MPKGLMQSGAGRLAKQPGSERDGSATLALYGVALATSLVLIPTFAFAYVGPGLGLGAIGSVFSLIGAVFLGVVGFIWYPIKRLLKVFRRAKTSDASDE